MHIFLFFQIYACDYLEGKILLYLPVCPAINALLILSV